MAEGQLNAEYFNRIASVYGIGVDEFLDLFEAQGHKCAICRCDLVLFSSRRSEKPVVDHDHKTAAVRGILCHPCNVAVGWLEKDMNRTQRAAGYICGFRDGVDGRPPPQARDWNNAQWRAWRKTRGMTPAEAKQHKRSAELAKTLDRAAAGTLGKSGKGTCH